MIAGYSVRNLAIKPGLVLAPMSGVTARPFRRLIKELNGDAVGLVVTEFISVEALTRRVNRSLDMMRFSEMERPFSIQIFGYDIERMCEAARMAEDGGAQIVDINSGCPAPKVVRKGGGCNLMREPEHTKALLKALRAAVKGPLTMKIRSGWDDKTKNALEIAKIAEGEGLDALAIHGRTRAQMYRGDADWDLVSQIAQTINIPVLGSGDVVDRASADARFKLGIRGILIGRGALMNPFVFKDIVNNTHTNIRTMPDVALNIIDRYQELLLEDFNHLGAIGKLKQLTSQMCRGLPWRKDICMATNLQMINDVIKRERDILSKTSEPPALVASA